MLKVLGGSSVVLCPIGLDFIKSHLKEGPMVHPSDTSILQRRMTSFPPSSREMYKKTPSSWIPTWYVQTMDVLKSFPAVWNLLLKLNTPLPASAACERLFSTAGLIFRPRRAHLDSKNFENQLLLRLNKRFW